MKNLYKQLGSVLILLSVIFGAGFTANRAVATLKFVQTPTITLYSSISGSATSMRVTPYPKDLDGTKLTITDFGSSPTATIDPKVRNYEEVVGFTGITDNGDGTATLTGLTRDLTSKSPYTTVGTGRSHSASAIVVFSNNPQMYARFAAPENTATITGAWTFGFTPIITSLPINPTDASNKAYVDSVAVAGASNADTSTKGIVQLPTALQIASSTKLGSTGAALGLTASSSTSTPSSAMCGLGCIVATQNDGKISPLFFATSSSYTYNWAASTTYSGKLQTGTLVTTATTTIAASGTSTNPLILSTVPYAFPSTQGASSTVWENDGHGNFFSLPPSSGAVSTSTTFATLSSGSVTKTVYCVAPKIVAGGGVSGVGVSAGSGGNVAVQVITDSYPSAANAWTASVECYTANGTSCSTPTATVYAMCVNP